MSFIGKALVTAQLVMSLLFMAFAGAVYSMHQNWREKYTALEVQMKGVQTSLATAQGELETSKTAYETKLAAETNAKEKAIAEHGEAVKQVAALTKENNDLQQQRNTQTGLAQAKAAEAQFRQEEAGLRQIENAKLQAKLDLASSENRDLLDQLATLTEELDDVTQRYNDGLKQMAYLKRVVAANKLPTDPREIEKLELPPPPVEGVVTTVTKDRTNRPKLIMLSIGADDGLLEGHILDVIRRSESKWMGKVKIVSVYPDEAVAEVIDAAANGIISEGDDVTTKL